MTRQVNILTLLLIFLCSLGYSSTDAVPNNEGENYAVGQILALSHQIPADSIEKEKLFKLLRHWVTIYSLYSNVDIGDNIDLDALGGEAAQVAGDLAEVFLFNGELQAATYGFKESTFVNIYPVGVLDHDHWMIEKLNEVSQSKFETRNAPFVKAEVHFVHQTDGSGYTVNVELTASTEITEALEPIQNAINTSLGNTTYERPKDAKETVNTALFTGFETLRQTFGTTYVPDIAIRFDEELYTDGNVIEVWRADDGSITLEAVTQLSNIEWINETSNNPTDGEVDISEVGDQTIALRAGGSQIEVTIRVQEFNLDINEILKTILKEVINDRVQAARDRINELSTNQEELQATIATNEETYLQSQGYPTDGSSDATLQVYFEEIEDQRTGTDQELAALKSDPTVNALIEGHRSLFISIAQVALELNIEVFLNALIDDPRSLNIFVEEIKASSPDLIADLIINLTRSPENRTQLKTIVVEFLNEQIASISEE